MADILRIRITSTDPLKLQFEDEHMNGFTPELDQLPAKDISIDEGDVWSVQLVSQRKDGRGVNATKVAVVRLIAKELTRARWEGLTEIPDFWMATEDIQDILAWLHAGTDIILIGEKGSGKTTFPRLLAKTLGWQEPCKVDVASLKKGTDLFGSNAAVDGKTVFIRSNLLDYIERAIIAHHAGIEGEFIILMDEINRVHAKISGSLHGLFDDTRQVSLITAEGTKVVKLPPNMHVIGTMNMGTSYTGTFQLGEALKDRFAAHRMEQMPLDVEVRRLAEEENILERHAYEIVRVARRLRKAPGLSFSPSFRGCRFAAQLVKRGRSLPHAIHKGFLAWYEGGYSTDGRGNKIPDPNTELARAFAVLQSQGVSDVS